MSNLKKYSYYRVVRLLNFAFTKKDRLIVVLPECESYCRHIINTYSYKICSEIVIKFCTEYSHCVLEHTDTHTHKYTDSLGSSKMPLSRSKYLIRCNQFAGRVFLTWQDQMFGAEYFDLMSIILQYIVFILLTQKSNFIWLAFNPGLAKQDQLQINNSELVFC